MRSLESANMTNTAYTPTLVCIQFTILWFEFQMFLKYSTMPNPELKSYPFYILAMCTQYMGNVLCIEVHSKYFAMQNM